jgi:hypothetical protein
MARRMMEWERKGYGKDKEITKEAAWQGSSMARE